MADPPAPPEGTVKVPSSKSRVPRSNKKPPPEEVRAAQMAKLDDDLAALNPDTIAQARRSGQLGLPMGDPQMRLQRDQDFEIEQTRGKMGFWAEGEPELGPDEDYYGDDITSLGHGELELQREIRHYARLIAWELPLLNRRSLQSNAIDED
jgi:small subunit ribosomal protein S35